MPQRPRSPRAVIALLALALAGGLALVGPPTAQAIPGPEDQSFDFAATPGTLGAVPDKIGATCGFPGGVAKDIEIPVSGIDGPLSDVTVSATMAAAWMADLTLTLIAPDGTTSAVLASRAGNSGPTSCGDNSDLGGAYTFNDQAASNWWTAAIAANGTTAIPPGSYRSSNDIAPGTPSNALSTFDGIAEPNGTWILRAVDTGAGDVITISAASLSLTVNARPILDVAGTPDGAVVVDAPPSYDLSSTDFDLEYFACSLDGGAFDPCGSPYEPNTATLGDHTVAMRAVDFAGQVSESVVRTFTYNTQACINAATAIADRKADLKTAADAVADAQVALIVANSAKVAAEKAVTAAEAKVAKATKALAKAKAALKAAQKSGDAAKVKAAKAAVTKATKALKAAQAASAKAAQKLAAAIAVITIREGQAADADQDLDDAGNALEQAIEDKQTACSP